MPLQARDTPPLGLFLLATTPSGRVYRWGDDELQADKVFSGLTDSDSVPGGFKELTCTLPRKPGVEYGDMTMGTHLELFGAGGFKIGEYRLERAPVSSGDQISIDPAAYGYQNHLADDESAQEIFIDADLGAWGEPSAARKLEWLAAALTLEPTPSADYVDTSGGLPCILFAFVRLTKNSTGNEAWYYGGGVDLGRLLYNFRGSGGDPAWTTVASLANNSDTSFAAPTIDQSTDYNAQAEALQQEVAATAAGRKYAFFSNYRANEVEVDPWRFSHRWECVKVLGRHGLALYGIWPNVGLLASDVIAYAVGKYAPLLNYTTGENGTIRPTAFVIPHLEFKEPGPISEWISQANRFELNEWAVWDNKTFYLNGRGAREGRKRWKIGSSTARLQGTGQQMDRVWNGVIVGFADVDGTQRYVGPPGSGYRIESEGLADTDPNNPANEIAGLKRYVKIATNGTCTAAGAVRVGELFLEQTKELDGSGTATIVGYAEDEYGTLWPYYCVRSGDLIRFPDASQPGWRYIVNTTRNHAERTTQIELEAPPDSLSALLERLDVSLVGFIG